MQGCVVSVRLRSCIEMNKFAFIVRLIGHRVRDFIGGAHGGKPG
jgi:hypothetical protein